MTKVWLDKWRHTADNFFPLFSIFPDWWDMQVQFIAAPLAAPMTTLDTKMNDWIATMNNIRRATVKRRSGSDRARLRRGGGGPGRAGKPSVKSEREPPPRRGEARGRRRGRGAARVTLWRDYANEVVPL